LHFEYTSSRLPLDLRSRAVLAIRNKYFLGAKKVPGNFPMRPFWSNFHPIETQKAYHFNCRIDSWFIFRMKALRL